jgi:hypothetical protein
MNNRTDIPGLLASGLAYAMVALAVVPALCMGILIFGWPLWSFIGFFQILTGGF